ncbi:integral membrane protein DUF92-domain-containing protein [Phyllosticta citribraziliensis]|uniref:Integral membrane protein DUF92-domain-containing protein n=1 Tax=Phyllosticta citribraziliensis TaxID=989973 RepID=A0ABR1LM63_9PEZI
MKLIIAVPATAGLVYRAWSHKSLTPLGILVAALTAVAHAVHPWSVFFVQLVVFFLAGSAATKVKHDIKARLTHSSAGGGGGEGPRTHVQVLANSAVASVLVLLHAWSLYSTGEGSSSEQCFPRGGASGFRVADLAVVGAVVNYAATASDTLSSELGILSSSPPRLILPPFTTVPRGTNGGVSRAGLLAGLGGSVLLALTATLLLPFCPSSSSSSSSGWDLGGKLNFTLGVAAAGLVGSVLDSILGATLQASVVDVRSGKVVEGDGGRRVPVRRGSSSSPLRPSSSSSSSSSPSLAKTSAVDPAAADAARDVKARAGVAVAQAQGQGESRKIVTGRDLLSNNGVNLLMAALTSAGAMVVAGVAWGVFW